MSASNITTAATATVPVVPPRSVPASTLWRDRGWTDAALAALFGGPSYQAPAWWSRREVRP